MNTKNFGNRQGGGEETACVYDQEKERTFIYFLIEISFSETQIVKESPSSCNFSISFKMRLT
jgi:hypothetical protein